MDTLAISTEAIAWIALVVAVIAVLLIAAGWRR